MAIPADPDDTDLDLTPESYTIFFPLPVMHSGAGSNLTQRNPVQVCNDGEDNDGDTLVDLLDTAVGACRPPTPLAFATTDTDGDGYSDEAEIHVGTDALGRCGLGGTPTISTTWPADINDAGGTSRDELNTADLALVIAFGALGKSPGQAGFNRRYDMAPGPGPLGSWINTLDLAQMTTFVAPMFGVKAFSYTGTGCTAHPVYGE